MTRAFVTPTLPNSSCFGISHRNAITTLQAHRTAVVCARSHRAMCMVGENPSAPPERKEDNGEVKIPVPQVGAEEMANPEIDTRGDPTLSVEVSGLPDPLATMAEEAKAAEDSGETFTLESINDDLADVQVLEECKPPQWYVNRQAIAEARSKFKRHETDTGSPEYQIATLTTRIQYLTNHLRKNKKDYASTRGLLKMVATRTKLLRYVRRESQERFHNIIEGLNIRISQQLRELGE